MEIRLLFATPDPESAVLLDSLLVSALELTPLNVTATHVTTEDELLARADADADDVVVLDWLLANAETPAMVATLGAHNPRLRIVALLPQSYRQYRRQVWQAGACSSIAKENMEHGFRVFCASCTEPCSARQDCTPTIWAWRRPLRRKSRQPAVLLPRI